MSSKLAICSRNLGFPRRFIGRLYPISQRRTPSHEQPSKCASSIRVMLRSVRQT